MLVVSGPNGRAANIALNRWIKDTVCIQTCKRTALQQKWCPVYEQGCRATCGFIRQRRFGAPSALDRFPRREQHRSYTNKMTGGERHVIIEAPPELRYGASLPIWLIDSLTLACELVHAD
jgi:hypothetical protein